MVSQYTDSYGSISADVQNLVANKVSLLDQYVLMQTGQNEYTGLVKDVVTGDCKEYKISRMSGTGYNNAYTITTKDSTFDYKVSNEYYVYSNVGVGKSIDLPVMDGVVAHSLCFIVCVLSFAIFFKGVLFKCLRRKR